MKFYDLPIWAQLDVKLYVKDHFLRICDEARKIFEDVPYFSDDIVDFAVMNYLYKIDSFHITFNVITGDKRVTW